jgi:hypothetical protein
MMHMKIIGVQESIVIYCHYIFCVGSLAFIWGGRECTRGEVTNLTNVSEHLLNEFLYFVRRFQSICTKREDFISTMNVGMLHSVIIYVYLCSALEDCSSEFAHDRNNSESR